MTAQPELWTICLTCPPGWAQALEDMLADEALAVSTLFPPREPFATVEAIMDGEPNRADIESRVAIMAASLEMAMPDASKELRAAMKERADAAPIKMKQGQDKKKASSPITLIIAPVGQLDWIKKVAEDFPPLPIARWTIFGAAHKKAVKNPRMGLQIDATSAFGTGEHPTTRGCLILLDWLLKKHPEAHDWNMLDMGCGSGILAMAFCKAVRGRAFGVDMDGPSVGIAKDNARHNGLMDYVTYDISLGYRNHSVRRKAPYDLIMANIFARPLCRMAKDLKNHLKPGGWAILSGLLNTQANAVLSAHRQQGLYLAKRLRLGEWSVLAIQRPLRA